MAATGAATTEALRRQLSSSSADAVAQALAEIRARTRLGSGDLSDYGEARVPPADERLRLACELCVADVLPRVWDAWELASQRDLSALQMLVYQVLAQLLRLLSVHQPNHALAEGAMVDRLLDATAPWMARLQESISSALRLRGTGGNDVLVVLTGLQLLAALAAFGRGKHAYAVWERFHWTQDLHRRLLSMRRRARRGDKRSVSMTEPDVRTQYMQFLLGLLAQSFHPSLKLALLDLGAEGLPALLRDLVSDPPDVVRYVLLVLHDELFQDTHLARSAKAKFLHEKASQWLVALYAREHEHAATASVADLVHHFLLSIATHPGQGVCYADRGWYGRHGDASTIHNHVLLTLLRHLRVAHDLRQQELALRLLRACPELVGPALSRLTPEVRADSACFIHMAYLGRVLALPVPPVAGAAQPPPVTAVLAHTAPENVCRVLAKAWRHDNALVQYYASVVTTSLLERVCAFQRAARAIAHETGESETGTWTSALHTLELAWRKRLPGVEVVYPLVQSPQALRREAALRVLALYIEALPSMAFDTHWDAGRVLTGAFLDKPASAVPWERVSQVHALRVLAAAAPALDLAAKVPAAWPGLDKRSFLHFLLAVYAHSETHEAVRAQCAALLRTFLHATALFSHDADELEAWMMPLAAGPVALAERAVVLAFLDECMLRCLKTPYRYAERVRELAGMDGLLSPLLATVTEQTQIRLQKRLWNAPEAACIVAYVEQLCRQLIELGKPVPPLVHVAERLAQGAHAASAPAMTASLCATLEAACRVPPPSVSITDPVLASRPATYGALVAHVGDAWRGMLAVWLQRLDPAAPDAVALLAPTFDALDTWAAAHQLHTDALHTYVMAHPSTQQWLAHASPRPFLARLVPWVCAVAAKDDTAYASCVAPLVDAIVARLIAAPADPVWIACATQLAPFATVTHLTHIMAAVPIETATDNQLHALAQMLHQGPTQSLGHAAWTPLYTQWPVLVQQASRSTAARTLLDTLLAATLPAGTDPFVPPTYGSLAAWRVARQHATAPADWHALAQAGAHATLARALYLVPEAAASVCDVRAPLPLCALLELGKASPLSDSDILALVPPSLHDTAACVSLALARAGAPHTCDEALAHALRAWSPDGSAETAWLVSQCAPPVREAWLDVVLPHLTRRFAEDPIDAPSTLRLANAARALARGHAVPAHVAEPVLVAILHHRPLAHVPVRLACALARAAVPPLRASMADRLVNALLARTEVVQAARAGPLRRALVALLVLLAQPGEALASPTSLARMLYLYTGTLEPCDRALRALLERRGLSGVLGAWKADSGTSPVPADLVRESVLTALLSLEPRHTYAACVHMPRTAAGAMHPRVEAYEAYDPWFVLNLVAGAMFEREQQGPDARLTGLEWLAILRTGALGVVLCTLSTHRAALRLAALQVLGKVYASLGATEFREKELALLVLERVRDCVPAPPATSVRGTYDEVPWLPTMPLLLAAHGLRALAAPHQPLFPVLFRFLLQRPLLDTGDVPLLYGLLHSTTDEAPAERAWILRFLTDALHAHALVAECPDKQALPRAKGEGKAFKRRHVWELVLSLYGFVAGAQSMPRAEAPAEVRQAEQLEALLEAAASIPYMAQDLITRRGFLAWISATVSAVPPRSESRAAYWLRILRRICAPSRLDEAHVLRRLALMDARTDHGLVASVLLPATRVWATLSQHSQECVYESASLLYTLLAYSTLREVPWMRTEGALATSLLQSLVRAADPEPAVSDKLLRCTLLLASLDPSPHVRALFASQPLLARQPLQYEPRQWALTTL
ncbi:Uncharacterized protein MSYG_0799 [Malassezia sympodialis ATCC 42132]|uniref:Uncharacterized protein n=1 Tax=Malassezia sympodialis (strain ATCC 42132) TaxID=1230383 RepID=A0A1M8A234_MALS4|nr:Uncharacterized protein MSYG_0799 [Malassezia sympodialis ATCC 42132]